MIHSNIQFTLHVSTNTKIYLTDKKDLEALLALNEVHADIFYCFSFLKNDDLPYGVTSIVINVTREIFNERYFYLGPRNI